MDLSYIELGAWALWENSAPNARARLSRSRFPRLQWHSTHLHMQAVHTRHTLLMGEITEDPQTCLPIVLMLCLSFYSKKSEKCWNIYLSAVSSPMLLVSNCWKNTLKLETGVEPIQQEYRYPTTCSDHCTVHTLRARGVRMILYGICVHFSIIWVTNHNVHNISNQYVHNSTTSPSQIYADYCSTISVHAEEESSIQT